MQRLIEKPSQLLIPLIAAAALLAALGTGFAAVALNRTASSAAALNAAGAVLATTQRALAYELSGNNGEALLTEAEAALRSMANFDFIARKSEYAELRSAFGTLFESVRSGGQEAREARATDPRAGRGVLALGDMVWLRSGELQAVAGARLDAQKWLFIWSLAAMLTGVVLTLLSFVISKFIVADKVEVEAAFDPMTGALRRDRFIERLSGFIASKPKDHAVGVVMIDIDRFKGINDSFGHDAGDKVLAAVSGAVRSLVREGDAFGRLGGEEFAVALRSKDPRAARLFAERARAAVESLRLERLPHVTISLGAVVLKPGEKCHDALKRADSFLYAAKAAGRNRVRGD